MDVAAMTLRDGIFWTVGYIVGCALGFASGRAREQEKQGKR